MSFVKKPEAFSISEIKSKAMDRINMGGTFLQQSQSVTISGLPVAIRKGGAGSLGSALSTTIGAVQQAGSIASLVQNPMASVQNAVNGAIAGVSGKLSAISSQLTGGQLSSITGALSNVTTALSDFQAHTSNLSGLSSAISDDIPDFTKLQNVGETLRGFGTDSTSGFIANTASALKSSNQLSQINDKLNITIQGKMDQILRINANTIQGQTEIASIVTEIDNILNTSKSTMDTIVTDDTHNFNEAANNLTASQDVVGLAEQYEDANSVSYSLLVGLGVGKPSTLATFDTAIETSTSN